MTTKTTPAPRDFEMIMFWYCRECWFSILRLAVGEPNQLRGHTNIICMLLFVPMGGQTDSYHFSLFKETCWKKLVSCENEQNLESTKFS